MTQRLTHYNPTLFPNPVAFIPERWLDIKPTERKRLEKYVQPFGKGSRSCVGIQYVLCLSSVSQSILTHPHFFYPLVAPKLEPPILHLSLFFLCPSPFPPQEKRKSRIKQANPHSSLANSELYVTIAKLFSYPTLKLKLFETTEDDIKQVHDFFSPFPDSERGLRVIVE